MPLVVNLDGRDFGTTGINRSASHYEQFGEMGCGIAVGRGWQYGNDGGGGPSEAPHITEHWLDHDEWDRKNYRDY